MSLKMRIGLAAAFGGMSQNLLMIAVDLTKEKAEMPEITFVIGLAIFGLMSAGLALVWDENDLKKAFYLGLSLPSIIQLTVGMRQKR